MLSEGHPYHKVFVLNFSLGTRSNQQFRSIKFTERKNTVYKLGRISPRRSSRIEIEFDHLLINQQQVKSANNNNKEYRKFEITLLNECTANFLT